MTIMSRVTAALGIGDAQIQVHVDDADDPDAALVDAAWAVTLLAANRRVRRLTARQAELRQQAAAVAAQRQVLELEQRQACLAVQAERVGAQLAATQQLAARRWTA